MNDDLPVCACDSGYRPDASGLLCFPVPTDADADVDVDVEPDVPDAGPDVPDVEADVPDVEADVHDARPDVDTEVESDVPDAEPDGPDGDGGTDGEVIVECAVDGDCEDYNVCTTDVCSPEGLCRHVAVTDDTPCPSDGNECTSDVCRRGACPHRPLADGTACLTDGNECTSDVCDAGMCAHEPTPGASCADDGDVCTAESCSATGACLHEPIAGCCNVAADCDDGNPCTVDACDGSSHVCRSPVAAADGTVCGPLGETCFSGRCAREVITNGGFDTGGTTGWTLEDTSYGAGSCTGYSGDWSVTGGRLRLHGHSATGRAVAYQDFAAARPLRIRYDYVLTSSCGGGTIALHDGGGTMLISWARATYYSGLGQDVVTRYTPSIAAAPGTCFIEEPDGCRSDIVCEQVSGRSCFRSGCAVSTMSGTFEAVFDWTTNRVTMRAGGVTLGTCAILDPTTFRVARVRFGVWHGCCDGRWDSYYAIDNVSVLVEAL